MNYFGNVERLRQEALDLTCTGNGQFVFRCQFVHTQNRDDVAQFLVTLQSLLHAACHGVVLFAHDQRIQLARGGVQRIDRRVDTQRSDVAAQHNGGVQVQEGCRRRRVGQVIRRNVHGLDGGNGTHLGRCNTLLQTAHFFSQCRLVTHGGRHTAQQRGHFGTGQCVAVDVVHEEQDVTAFVTEFFSHGQTGQRNAQTVAGRLVHLAEHHRDFGLGEVFLVDNACIGHFVVEVVTFTGTLTHAGEHGQTRVLLGDVVDQFQHVHGLAHTRAAEQADLTAFGERTNQVDHLDAGFQQVNRRRQFVELRCSLVNRALFGALDRAHFVDRATQHVHDTAQRTGTYRHLDRVAGCVHGHAATQTVGRTHGDGTNDAVTQLLLDFEGQARLSRRVTCVCQCQRFVYLRHFVAREFDVNHRADTLNNLSLTHFKIPRLN